MPPLTTRASGLLIPGRDPGARDRIAHRIDDRIGAAPAAEQDGDPDLPRDPWEPRYRIDSKWIEFECGCRAERFADEADAIRARAIPGDPIVFAGLPEMAVYDAVCHRHGPGMNKYVRFTGIPTFEQWREQRKAKLMGRSYA